MPKPYFRQVPNLEYVNRNKGNTSISDYINVKNLFKKGRIRPDIFGDLSFFTKYKIIGNDRPDNVAYEVYGDSTLDWVVLLSNNILNVQSEWPLAQNSLDDVLLKKYGSYEKLHSLHHYETIEIKNSRGGVILPGGLETSKTWRTNGNFIQAINTKINQITGTESKIATVTMNSGIKDLTVGDEILIQNVSDSVYNGRFPITSVGLTINDNAVVFSYALPDIPTNTEPEIKGTEQATFTVAGNIGTGNAYYYEYFDDNQYNTVPASSIIKEVTNYQYEIKKEDAKRNIYLIKPQFLNILYNDMDKIMPYKKGGAQYVSPTLKKGENIRLYE